MQLWHSIFGLNLISLKIHPMLAKWHCPLPIQLCCTGEWLFLSCNLFMFDFSTWDLVAKAMFVTDQKCSLKYIYQRRLKCLMKSRSDHAKFFAWILVWENHNPFCFSVELLHVFEYNTSVSFPAAPLLTVVLALVGECLCTFDLKCYLVKKQIWNIMFEFDPEFLYLFFGCNYVKGNYKNTF